MSDIPWDWSGRRATRDPDEAFQDQTNALIATLGGHGAREGAALDAYARLIDQTENNGIRYLGQLILEDEERHHRIIEEMLNSVRAVLQERDPGPRVPSMVGKPSAELVEETERLLAFEREDLEELRALRKDLNRRTSFPLFGLLINLMVQDTRKHIDILEFIRDRA